MKKSSTKRLPDSDKHWIYFIQCETGPIKIGMTYGCLNARLGNLQVGTPHELKVLAAVQVHVCDGYNQEDWLHSALADHHIRGEWFKPDQRVLDYAYLAKKGHVDAIRELTRPEGKETLLEQTILFKTHCEERDI